VAHVVIRRNEISKLAYLHRVPEKTIEQDYVITRVLRELGPGLAALGLRFKGGTCLKKAHFAEYRFSEDLDFTLERGRDVDAVEAALEVMSAVLTEEDVTFELGEPQRRGSGLTYFAATTGPLGRPDKLKIDVTTREMLLFPAVDLELHDEYSDGGSPVSMNCYSVEEIFLEKMVCMLDPKRIQPRDLFDLDYLMEAGAVDTEAALWPFPEKVRFKGLDPSSLRANVERKSARLRRLWEEQLSQQVPEGTLPGYDDAERRFMRLVREHRLA
jgi:predicted nucleotidyltransferase component of viral defense system